MIGRRDVAEVEARLRRFLNGPEGLSPAARDQQYAYLSANAWRYALTVHELRQVCAGSLAGQRIIDIGAYPGHLAAVLSRGERAVVQAITLVTDTAFAAQMQRLDVTIAVCDVERERLPVEDRSAPIVMCCELIEHLDGDVLHMLVEARRVLSEGGVFLLTTPNHASFGRRWELLRGRSVYPPLDDPVYPFYAGTGQRNPWRHVREFTVTEIRDLLRAAGFGRVEVTTHSPPFANRAGLSLWGVVSSCLIQGAAHLARTGGTLILGTARY